MKKSFNISISLLLTLSAATACRTDDTPLQEIDQTLQIFVDSSGVDMLNKNLLLSYKTVAWNDINGLTDNTPVSYDLLKTSDTLSYLQYVAGAKRILIDSSNMNRKLYQSKIALRFSKPTVNSGVHSVNDTMIINYSFTPERFQIDNVIYNNVQVFTKTVNGENQIKINK